MPSISTSSWLSTRSPTLGPPVADLLSLRAAANPSISSRKITEGAAARALNKNEVLSHTLAMNMLEHYVDDAGSAFQGILVRG